MSTLLSNNYTINQMVTFIQLAIDFGLVVLIWMVQLIVYPSFLYYKEKNLINWHQKYTQKIAIIVVPLMLLQLLIATYHLFCLTSTANGISLATVIFLWGFTFTSFAPIHFKISEGKHTKKDLDLLISRNWWRTFLWTILFVFNVLA